MKILMIVLGLMVGSVAYAAKSYKVGDCYKSRQFEMALKIVEIDTEGVTVELWRFLIGDSIKTYTEHEMDIIANKWVKIACWKD
jgi:hypothetical protein